MWITLKLAIFDPPPLVHCRSFSIFMVECLVNAPSRFSSSFTVDFLALKNVILL